MKKENKHLGSSFEEFLMEEGIYEEVVSVALKEAIAYQIEKEMKKKKFSKTEMAKKMKTSRAALDRLLDPKNGAVTLQTLQNAASALGKRLQIKLI
jgi:DNA-binding Xre family transcriptional regulator